MANAASEDRQASSGKLGNQMQNHNRVTAVGLSDICAGGDDPARGAGSMNGNSCCFTVGVGALSRATTGDFHGRAMVKADYLIRPGVHHDF